MKRARIRSGRPAIGLRCRAAHRSALQAMLEIVLRTAMTQHHHFIDHRFSSPRSLAVCHTHLSTTPRMAAWRFLSRLGRSSPNTAVKMCVMWPCTPSMMATWMCRSRWSKLPAGSALHSSYLTGRPMMLIFPPQVPMEQCSSQFTAQYKARLAQRLLAEEAVDDDSPASLVDLTGGFGVDFSYMSRVFNRATYVEQQSILCDIARHNFPILGLDHAEVINDDSTAVLDTLGRVSMIFLDPARRDDHGSRTYAIADCMPDVLTLKDMLLAKHRRSWSSSPPCSTGIRPSPISPARYMRCISSPPGMSARNCCWCWGAAVASHRSWYVLMTSRCCRTRPAITATITPLSAILLGCTQYLQYRRLPV